MCFCVSLQEINCNHLVKANTLFRVSLFTRKCLREFFKLKNPTTDVELGANYLNDNERQFEFSDDPLLALNVL